MIGSRAARLLWRLFNPLVVALALWLRVWAVVETTGRVSGKPRVTPVANGLVGDEFWILAVHGREAQFVRNLEVQPSVRVRIGRRWRDGLAEVLPPDAAVPAKLGTYPRWGPRTFSGDALPIRIRLQRT